MKEAGCCLAQSSSAGLAYADYEVGSAPGVVDIASARRAVAGTATAIGDVVVAGVAAVAAAAVGTEMNSSVVR